MMSRITTAVACFIFLLGALALPSFALAGSATLSWQPNTEADFSKYRVYYSTTAGAYGSYKAEVPKGTTTYVANSLTEGQTYYFVLTAVDTSGNESGFSSPVSKAITGTTTSVPSAPVMVSPANGSSVAGTSVTFSWQAAQGATDYNLKIYSSTGAVTFDQWLGNVTSKTVTGFANAGQSQSWSVTARNATGTGAASAQWTFTNGSGTSVPAGPVLVFPANGSTVAGTSITFKWNASPGATQYVFRQWRQNGTLNVERNVGNVTSYTMSGFSNSGYTNSWSVTALNAAGQGTSSAKWTFTNAPTSTTTVPPAPVMVSPANGSSVAGTSVTFSWQAVTGATDYNLKIYSSTGAVTFNQWLGNVTTKTVTGFANQGQTQSWSITARNNAGTGPESARWSFTNGTAATPGSFLISPANGASVGGTSITFKWNRAPNATYYRLRIFRADGTVFWDHWIGGSLSYNVGGFPNNGASFSWQVYPYGSSGQLPLSPKWTFTNK